MPESVHMAARLALACPIQPGEPRRAGNRYSIVCQFASLCFISNGPVFGLISIRYLPLNFLGTRHEYRQVPPHP
jgi:hypothetical protein